jgi:tight adherence protein C
MIPELMSATLATGAYLILVEALSLRRPSLSARIAVQPKSAIVSWIPQLSIKAKAVFSGAGVPKAKLQAALFELPEILELLAVALTAGDGVFAAFSRVIPRAKGFLAQELKMVLVALELGGDLETELRDLARRVPQRQVVEFANKLVLSLRRGSPLAALLREQCESARAEIRNNLLRQAGKNETKMLIPLIFLILPVTILFAIYPSLQLLNMNYL